jgi:hypothetical protein
MRDARSRHITHTQGSPEANLPAFFSHATIHGKRSVCRSREMLARSELLAGARTQSAQRCRACLSDIAEIFGVTEHPRDKLRHVAFALFERTRLLLVKFVGPARNDIVTVRYARTCLRLSAVSRDQQASRTTSKRVLAGFHGRRSCVSPSAIRVSISASELRGNKDGNLSTLRASCSLMQFVHEVHVLVTGQFELLSMNCIRERTT